MNTSFVHLRVHSEYSLKDGLIRIKSCMNDVVEKEMNAIALTDHCNLFATVKFYQNALKAGVKPIIGADIPCHDPHKPEIVTNLIMLCQNDVGYKNLTKLVSKAYQEGQYQGLPYIQYKWIKQHSEGLIVLSGGLSGFIGQALIDDKYDLAYKFAKNCMDLFPGRFYLEVQRTQRPKEALYNKGVLKLAEALDLPLVATNDVRFHHKDDFDAHEARVAIHQGYTINDPRREKTYSEEQYLKSANEMIALFKDLPQAIENTVEISKRCNVMLELGKNYLPDFPVPQSLSINDFLTNLSEEGLKKRLKSLNLEQESEQYLHRLHLELDVINSMGFPGYFLIVADFIKWAKENDVPVGPGRGSGAGSLVAYALEITDLNPLEYDLLFERFLNPERVSMPDFDIDFCMEGRDRVIEYVAQKYGRQSVSQIITFGTMAAKAVVRDVGRVLGYPYGFVDKIAKLIPFELGITLSKALEQTEELKHRFEQEEDVKALIELALKLEGVTRNAGKHAGGVVIAPNALTDFTGIFCEQGSNQLVTQFDKDDVEAAGLVKFDFLGLRTLTIIHWAIKSINHLNKNSNNSLVDISQIPMNDKKTFELLKTCQTTAVFQLESRGMKELISRLQPDCFEEIIALVALFRPGPLQSGMVDDFIDRKHGRAEVLYPHPELEPILKPTYGVILYQEQVMQIAQVLANYTLGAADLLRRAMGKKKPEEMAKQRNIFIQGATQRDVDEDTAAYIFDLMEKFAGYGFNKSHSAAYALVAYQTAWLKAHYPAAFMASVLSSDMDNTDKIVIFIQECKALGLQLLPPNINQSFYRFTVKDEKTIIFGLGAIKGLGESAIQNIINERDDNGLYQNLFDFCKRNDLRKVNRRVLEALIKSGSFDDFHSERAILNASIEHAMQISSQHQAANHTGQTDLLSLLDDDETQQDTYLSAPSWDENTRLQGEKQTIGFYLTGHPAQLFCQEFSTRISKICDLDKKIGQRVIVCALITNIRKITTKRGKKLVILGLEDGVSQIETVIFQEVFEQYSDIIKTDSVVLIEAEASFDNYNNRTKLTASAIYSPDNARGLLAKKIHLSLNTEHESIFTILKNVMIEYKGPTHVQISYQNNVAKVALLVSEDWSVKLCAPFLKAIHELIGQKNVQILY